MQQRTSVLTLFYGTSVKLCKFLIQNTHTNTNTLYVQILKHNITRVLSYATLTKQWVFTARFGTRITGPHKGCECPVTTVDSDNAKRCANSGGWLDQPVLSELNVHQSHQLIWVRANHMIYDYCSDTSWLPSVPVECEQHRH
ncbi:putative xyloglucan:xyloglucosyl transferase [Helianthus debilis subsp. tardiflorus]